MPDLSGDLVGRLTAALLAERWADSPRAAHGEHRFDSGCAICQGDVDRLAAFVVHFLAADGATRKDSFPLRDRIEHALYRRLCEQVDLSVPGAGVRAEARAADLADAVLPVVEAWVAEQTQHAEHPKITRPALYKEIRSIVDHFDVVGDPDQLTGPIWEEIAPVLIEYRDEAREQRYRAEQAEAALKRVEVVVDAMRNVPGTRAWATRLDAAITGSALSIGARIHELRTAQGRSLSELAVAAGTTRETIRHIETGKTAPLSESLDALAAALGVPRAALDGPEET